MNGETHGEPRAENNAYTAMLRFFKLNEGGENPEIIKRLADGLKRRAYAHGEAICRIGDAADCMYFIESGKAEVLSKDDVPVNELDEGDYFGEYAVLTEGNRLTTVCSKGGTVVYRLDKADILAGASHNPALYGNIIQRLYTQISQKHTQIRKISSKRRGLIRSSENQKKMPVRKLLINYGIVAAVFLLAFLLPEGEALAPVWYFLPIVFLMASIILTKRTLEAFVLGGLLTMVMLYKGNFLYGFYNKVLDITANRTIMEIVVLIALLGAMTRLLAASGAINALRRFTVERIKTRNASLLASFLCMIIIFIDDHLSLEITGMGFMPVKDRNRVPREMSAFVMGMTPGAVNILVPFSIWGIYLSGILIYSLGEAGMSVFLRSIPFNFAAILTLLMVFTAGTGKLPLIGRMKKARERVDSGGPVWPPNSEQFTHEEENAPRGSLINLFLPLLILPVASVIAGLLIKSATYVHIGAGLLVTLFVMFCLYCFTRLMTPEEFFDNIIAGVEHTLVPILLLIVTFIFSGGIKEIGLVEWLSYIIPAAIGNNVWLLPAAVFLVFMFISIVWGSSWSIFAIGIPIAVQLAAAVDGNMALYAGAVCAAGIAGDALSVHQSDNEDVAFIVGCEPMTLYFSRLPYFIAAAALSFALYVIMGIMNV
jgi:Na+/H+ antiporter NhaC